MDEIQWAEALRGFSFDASDTLTPERPNVFRIAGFPQREQVSSNMLAWLFDPQGNHGLGALAVETLLSLIGRTDATADEATVDTEVTTDGGKRIDILVCTPDLAVAVENKATHGCTTTWLTTGRTRRRRTARRPSSWSSPRIIRKIWTNTRNKGSSSTGTCSRCCTISCSPRSSPGSAAES
ncbi:PD-(D/E)XK nuclease family protein [Bifidobacterium pullorum]|uniref:PD-(D/E)XK nuclease family protein n=1 Tax=Bifidobacterium pullorum TaxID=78448 RepID=UPI003F26283F